MVQPAPRIRHAPRANRASRRPSGRAPRGAARLILQAHGRNSSQLPETVECGASPSHLIAFRSTSQTIANGRSTPLHSVPPSGHRRHSTYQLACQAAPASCMVARQRAMHERWRRWRTSVATICDCGRWLPSPCVYSSPPTAGHSGRGRRHEARSTGSTHSLGGHIGRAVGHVGRPVGHVGSAGQRWRRS